MVRRILCETDDTVAIYSPSKADRGQKTRGPLIITFPHLTSHLNGFSFWCDDMLAEAGVSAIGLMSRRPQWFVHEEMERVLPALLTIIRRHKPSRVVTLGYSMGGTPALMHGRTLRADLSVSFSPHYSVDPAIIHDFDARRKRTFDPALHTGFKVEPRDLAPLPVIFYDPLYAWDREHAARIEALSPRVQRIVVTGAGHYSITPFLRTADGEKSLIDLLLNGTAATIAKTARRLVRGLRHDTPDYHQELSEALLRHGHTKPALRSAIRAAELQPHNARRRIHLNDVRRRLDLATAA